MGEKGLKWLEQLWQCFLSIVKILLQSKWRTRLPSSFSNPDELLILANGPSLNRTVEDSTDFIKGIGKVLHGALLFDQCTVNAGGSQQFQFFLKISLVC